MKTRIWLIRGEKIHFPEKWDKKKVMTFINTNINMCPYCNKIDVRLEHLNECYNDYNRAMENEIKQDYFYK